MSGDGNDIKIGDKVIGESTTVTLTVKTAMFILTGFVGLLTLLFTWFYVDGRARDKQMKEDIEKFQKELKKDMEQFEKDIEEEISPISQNIIQIIREQGEIKGDIKVILNKQLGVRNATQHEAPRIVKLSMPIAPNDSEEEGGETPVEANP